MDQGAETGSVKSVQARLSLYLACISIEPIMEVVYDDDDDDDVWYDEINTYKPPSTYEWPYDTQRRSIGQEFEWLSAMPPGVVGLPGMQRRTTTAIEALDPAVLASRLQLFEAEHDKVFDGATREVKAGDKRDDWIWSIFPQAAGLPEHFGKDSSRRSRKFSILCFDEAVAFLEHPILGSHYLTIIEAVRDQLDQRGLKEIFNRPGRRDAKKVVSSVTLFRRAARVSWIEPERIDVQTQLLAAASFDKAADKLDDTIGILSPRWSKRPAATWPTWVESITPKGKDLIDHCDAILATADDENLEPCRYSEHFDSTVADAFVEERCKRFDDLRFTDFSHRGDWGLGDRREDWRGSCGGVHSVQS